MRFEQRGGRGHTVGAATRHAEGQRLWAAVAERLAAWADDLDACDVLYRSGDVRVWNLLYG